MSVFERASRRAFVNGTEAVSGAADGTYTISYGETFNPSPIVLANVDIGTSVEVDWFVSNRTGSDFTIKIRWNDAPFDGAAVVEWAAFPRT